MVARAAWETGREGKGFISVSEPEEEVSVCQPGKVARRRKVRKERTMATMLVGGIMGQHVTYGGWREVNNLHEVWKDDTVFEG